MIMNLKSKVVDALRRLDICLMVISVIFSLIQSRAVSVYLKEIAPNSGFLSSVSWIVRVAILTALYYFAFRFLCDRFSDGIRIHIFGTDRVQTKTGVWKDLRSVLAWFLLFFIAFLPVLIIRYPGYIHFDAMAAEYEVRAGILTTHHSVYHSVLFNRVVHKLISMGFSANTGLFVFNLCQYFPCTYALGYSVYMIDRLGVKKPIVYCVAFSYLLNPFIIRSIYEISKDAMYAGALLIFVVSVVDYLHDSEAFMHSWFKIIVMILGLAHTILVRKNGPFVIVPMVIIFLAIQIREFLKTHKLKKETICMGGILLIALVGSMLFKSWLAVYFDAKPASLREALALPVQQTARYAVLYGDDTPQDEIDAIENVFRYHKLVERYDPYLSDPTKGAFQEEEVSGDDLKGYFAVWFKQFLRHPLCYVDATLEQNLCLFLPEVNTVLYADNVNIQYDDDYATELKEKDFYDDIYTYPEKLKKSRIWLNNNLDHLCTLPVISWLADCSFYTFILLAVVVVACKRKLKCAIVLCPVVLSWLIVVAGPELYRYYRYMFPVVYCLPVCLGYIFSVIPFEESKIGD